MGAHCIRLQKVELLEVNPGSLLVRQKAVELPQVLLGADESRDFGRVQDDHR